MKLLGFNITRATNSAQVAKGRKAAAQAYMSRQQMQRIRQDAATRRLAIDEAERDLFPFRYRMQQMYLNTIENGHIHGCIERRKDLTLLRRWEFINRDGTPNQAVTDMFCDMVRGQAHNRKWFTDFINHTLDATYYGYSLVWLGDIENGQFPNIQSVMRWHVSPDRRLIMTYPYNLSGQSFDAEEYRNWYVFIDTPSDNGISPCGYGMLLKLSIYEIFARNLLGFNGDFVELFAQPFRVGKTDKTEEAERAEFEGILRDMGSSAYALLDANAGESIEFIDSGQSGTGFQSYDNFEARLQKTMSTIILGHPDAINSVPGKLGNDSTESPAQMALRDKQTKDGVFVQQAVNQQLIPRMRALGFNIPDGVVAVMKNDNEEVDNAENITDLAVKMKTAGLQMDAKYFTTRTGIPVQAAAPAPAQFTPSVAAKLKNLYGG